ncbi:MULTISPECIES: hypothetical protein [Mycobacterium]|uniref:hypothetical protein n=1 Tax=Mycobacterium TaxID=1763 RepID=UPI0005EF1AC6|nr:MULTISPECIES: hypothetical protein [Mycobacterium]MCV7034902.1 hypothetical protein [Mycobacterium heckeshornense]
MFDDDDDEVRDTLAEIADARARLAAFVDATDMIDVAPIHGAVTARFESTGALAELHIDQAALSEHSNLELEQIITAVLQRTHQELAEQVRSAAQRFISAGFFGLLRFDLDDLPSRGGPTAIESSRAGALRIAVDWCGYTLCCWLSPEVNAVWPAKLLSERIVWLYTAAAMQARCERGEQLRAAGRGQQADRHVSAPGRRGALPRPLYRLLTAFCNRKSQRRPMRSGQRRC